MTKYGLGLGTILAPWLCSGTGGRPRCVTRCVGPYQGCPRLWPCPPLARPIAAHFALHWERAFGSSLWGKRMEATAAQPKSAARAKAVLAPWGCPLRPLTTQWSQLRPCVAAAVAGTEVRALGAGQDVALVCAGVGGGVGLAPGARRCSVRHRSPTRCGGSRRSVGSGRAARSRVERFLL